MNSITSRVVSRGNSLTAPVISGESRCKMINIATRLDIMMKGKEDSIQDLVIRSRDSVMLRFSFIGFTVEMWLFFDENRGAILVDGYVFESFPLTAREMRSWPVFLIETMLVFINTGVFNHVGDEPVEKSIVSETIEIEPGDMILCMEPSPLMERNHPVVKIIASKPVLFHASTMIDDWTGNIPIIVKNGVFETSRASSISFTREEFVETVNKVHRRRVEREQVDAFVTTDIDDFLHRITRSRDDQM